MIEKKIEIEVVSANLKMNLTPDKSEALSEFKEKLLNVFGKSLLDLQFAPDIVCAEKIENIWVFENIIKNIEIRLS